MRRAFVIAVVLAAFAACGLDVVGVSTSATGGGLDASVDRGSIGCATLDASCLALPAGWTPIDVSDAGCAADFTPTTLRTNPTLAAGACMCAACTPTGAYACGATSPIHGGGDCGDDPFMTATANKCSPGKAQHLRAEPIAATHGTEGCTAASVVGPGAISDAITICAPSCSTDVCTAPPRCVIATGDIACPSAYPTAVKAGSSVDAGCAPCGCKATAPTGNCGGAVRAYTSSNCDDAGEAQTYTFGSCNTYPEDDYFSVLALPVPPDASCLPNTSTPGTGTPALEGVSTICCR